MGAVFSIGIIYWTVGLAKCYCSEVIVSGELGPNDLFLCTCASRNDTTDCELVALVGLARSELLGDMG